MLEYQYSYANEHETKNITNKIYLEYGPILKTVPVCY